MMLNTDCVIIQRATAAINQMFGAPVDLWIYHLGRWEHAVRGCDQDVTFKMLEVGSILPSELPIDPDLNGDPSIEELQPGLFTLGTPLVLLPNSQSAGGALVYAYGSIQSSLNHLVSSLLNTTRERDLLEREVEDFREGVNPHLEQLSYNFEELSYFRRLGQQIDLRDVSDPLSDLAQRILAELHPLIKAEAIGFIAADGAGAHVADARIPVARSIAWIGTRLLNDAACSELVSAVGNNSRFGEAIVINQMQSLKQFHSFAAIHSCIQVPVDHRGNRFGWLIALNRVPWHLRSTLPIDAVPPGLSDNEFGTSEASLMSSAASTLAAHYRNSELFREKELLLIGVVRALINAIDAKDSYTCGHSDRVAVFAKCIGEELGLDQRQCEQLYMSGLLHDLGKIGIPDHVLCKPGKLTEEEFAIIKEHPSIGHSILNHLPQLRHILPGVLHHHESVDGQGYPAGLSDDGIPLFARILAVADSYDAMTSARPYRSAMSIEKAVRILTEGAGTQWDRDVVAAFLKALPEIEAACAQADTHLQALLNSHGPSQRVTPAPQTDTIARAVTAIEL